MRFPGAKSAEVLAEFKDLGVVDARPFVINLEASHGMYLATIDGQEVFDWAGYYGAKLLGHNHPGYFNVEYMRQLVSVANNKVSNPDFVTPYLVEYYKFLHKIAPKCLANSGMRVYTVNSGAEAVENALKYCVHRFYRTRKPSAGRPQGGPVFMTFDGGFHGRTVFSLAMTDMPHSPSATRDFESLVRKQIRVPFPSWNAEDSVGRNRSEVDRVLQIVEDNLKFNHQQLAGIIVEPMQGAGGHRVAMPKFFQGLSRLSHQYDVPLIFDEVQTAGGQCGSMWMCDQFRLPHPPECVVSAKKTGCGVVYMRDKIPESGVLDSTWSGHLVDMVRVPHEYKIIEEEGLMSTVAVRSERMIRGLKHLQKKHRGLIFNVRGAGLYQGFTMLSTESKNNLLRRALHEDNMLLLGAGLNSIRFRPCLSVTIDEIDLMLSKLDRLLGT